MTEWTPEIRDNMIAALANNDPPLCRETTHKIIIGLYDGIDCDLLNGMREGGVFRNLDVHASILWAAERAMEE